MVSPSKHKLFTEEAPEPMNMSEIGAIELSYDGLYKKSPNSVLSASKRAGLLQKPYRNNAPPKRFLCFRRRQKNWKLMPDREIYPLIDDTNLPNNSIQTSKYTWLTFLPINLLEQFSQLANVYFLFIAFLQTVPEVSITKGFPIMVIPLSIVITISAIKSLFEDWKRHVSDNEENNRPIKVFRNEEFVKDQWKNLRVGDVVKVHKNEQIPADLIMVYTKDPKGRAYVETKSLDGETNLKMKFVDKDILSQFADNYGIAESHYASFMYEKPNPYLYQFKGAATIVEEKISLDYNNFLLRGSSLKNTEFIIGLVVYTGHETKIMLNSNHAVPKIPKVTKVLSRMVLISFACQLFFCALTAILNKVYINEHEGTVPYLDMKDANSSIMKGLIHKIGTWVLNFINFIPISLLTTLELIRFFQAAVISNDEKMVTGDIKPVVQSSTHNEELGQVQYVFTDKTGTLTANQMVFKKFSVNGHSYGEIYSKETPASPLSPSVIENVDFNDQGLFAILDNRAHSDYKPISNMLMAQAICHTVMVEHEDARSVFTASSPDELALVNFAKLCKYQYMGTDEHNILKVNVNSVEHEYQLLTVLDFTSDRKRMSVIVRDSHGQVKLFCKGADSIMLERLHKNTDLHVVGATKNHLTEFGNEGLRTLVYASRNIGSEEYSEWAKRYNVALTTMVDREKKVDLLQAEIETNMELLGATGIEDKLQDCVAETIKFFIDAEIKVWMLTGDKVETARSIGKSCGLIRPYMSEFIIDGHTDDKLESQLLEAINSTRQSEELFYYVLITGDALQHLTHSGNTVRLTQRFAELTLEARTVLACRVSPKQKQEVVEIVRKAKKSAITLAIGDGANDVNMITAAHVGIGIKGKEGLQAARASDFSIGEFKHLKRLTFYYGREFYRNNATAILYNFFKNIMLVLPQFWCGFINMFSGQTPYNVLLYQFFNTLYAALPIILYAIFDRQYKEGVFEENPKLYNIGRKNQIFRYSNFLKWVLNGAVQAAIIGLLPYMLLENVDLDGTGVTANFNMIGVMIFTIAVLNANIKVWLISYIPNMFLLLSIIGSVILYYISLYAISLSPTSPLYNAFQVQHQSLQYWAVLILVVIMSSGIDVIIGRISFFKDQEENHIDMKASSANMKVFCDTEQDLNPNTREGSFSKPAFRSFVKPIL